MFFVWALALAGLFLIYLEFFLPGAIMAIGGGILLLASIVMFHLVKPKLLFLLVYIVALSIAVFCVVRFAAWKIRFSPKHDPQDLKDMIGKKAKAATLLNPHGHIFIDENLYEARAKHSWIEEGRDVIVVGDEEGHLIVEIEENRT